MRRRTKFAIFGGIALFLGGVGAAIGKLMGGCWHGNYSFPITPKKGTRAPEAAGLTGAYVSCLDCGREFPYDWKEMRVLYPHQYEKYTERMEQLGHQHVDPHYVEKPQLVQ